MEGGALVGAIAAVNALGEIVDPTSGRVVAGVRGADGGIEDAVELLRSGRAVSPPLENTTIAVVATDVALDRGQLTRLALMAHAGLARVVRPSHTSADGDAVFALSTGARVQEPVDLVALGALAARALERAIVKGVRQATSLAGIPAVAVPVTVRPVTDADRDWIERFTAAARGAPVVVSRGVAHRPAALDGFVAERDGVPLGLVTVQLQDDACEVVTLNSLVQVAGVGTALMAAAEQYARDQGCRRLWLITTNDNAHALRFYQRRGLRIAAIHVGAIAAARALKPEIPLTGNDGIPIRDEIEMEKEL